MFEVPNMVVVLLKSYEALLFIRNSSFYYLPEVGL